MTLKRQPRIQVSAARPKSAATSGGQESLNLLTQEPPGTPHGVGSSILQEVMLGGGVAKGLVPKSGSQRLKPGSPVNQYANELSFPLV